MFGSRILLLAPHPDDELAGCCAAIGRARAGGSSVSIAFLTTGIPARERLWPWDRANHPAHVQRRREEARRVCAELGAEIVHFSEIAARRLKSELGAVRDLVVTLCAARQADALWVPAYEGGHPDHDAANFIASTLRRDLPVWEFSEYNFCGSRLHSNEFPAATGKEIELKLTEAEQRLKRKLLAMYASERGNLNYLQTEREVFRPLADYDYSRPPHAGRLFYRRFAWASFHPRVNEVRPEEVSGAIAQFRAQN
jgi:LmbE family N-acetylglucosaminyl deacetylase